jgi:hypothetical protein
MAQPACRISFLSSFADFVRQQRDAIGRTWMQLVRESPDCRALCTFHTMLCRIMFPRLMDGNDEPVIRLKRDA